MVQFTADRERAFMCETKRYAAVMAKYKSELKQVYNQLDWKKTSQESLRHF